MSLLPKPPSRSEEPVTVLLDCHERIRRFAGMAVSLGEAADPSAADLVDGATRVHRYFSVALPLHVLDEERSIAPRLAGSDRAAFVEAMRREHAEHAPLVARLVDECAFARDGLARFDRPALLRVARELSALFVDHLAMEERELFPALAALPAPERSALLAEIRARRT